MEKQTDVDAGILLNGARAMSISSDEILKLSVSERLSLIETIWNSFVAEPDALPLTDAQRREIDRRLERYAAERPRLNSWDEVRARLEAGE